MNKNLFALTLLATLCVQASASDGREGGGFGHIKYHFSCVEKAPANPKNPIVAYVTEMASGLQLIVRPSNSSGMPENPYIAVSNDLAKNTSINCFAPCEIFEGSLDTDPNQRVSFSVTELPNQLDGLFELGSHTMEFDCRRGEHLFNH